MRERKARKRIEEDPAARASMVSVLPIPSGTPEFKAGYRECLEMFALHAPNKRRLAQILDEHCITLEEACIRSNMARGDVAQYEGYRQAMKDLKTSKRMK